MQTEVKPKSSDDPHDFVVVPSDQVQVAPSDAEITDLLRAAAARQHSETGVRTASDPGEPASMPAVDTTFRATAVNDDVPVRTGSFGRRAMRGAAALLLALGIGAAAVSWQTFGYAAKKALLTWAPKWAIAASLPLEKLGLATNSAASEQTADAAATPAAVSASSDTVATASTPADPAAPPSDAAQQLQSMARDLANANQQVETLKASIAELKASQQQMARDLAKVTDKLAEPNAKPKIVTATPHAPQAARRPAPVYPPTAGAPPAYRPAASSYSAQAAATPPATTAQPYAPPPIPLQPEPGSASVPRPPMPVQ